MKNKSNMLEMVREGHQSFTDNIKMILYQKDSSIFDKIDFNDDNIYTDPLFFASLNSRREKYLTPNEIELLLNSLVFGYSKNQKFGCCKILSEKIRQQNSRKVANGY